MSSIEKPLRCVVVEDEEPLRTWLCERLREFEEVEVVGEAGSVSSAFRLIVQQKPNALFLDIKLIGGDAFQLLEQLKDNNVPIPPIIMTTAFDEYAPQTINHWGDYVKRYLQKPFVENWDVKLRNCINALLAANEKMVPPPAPYSGDKNGHFFIKEGNSLHRINFDELLWIEVAGGGAVYLVTDRLQMKWDITLTRIMEQLPPQFMQISRDTAVNTDKIIRIDKSDRGVILPYQGREKFLGVGESFYRDLLDRLNIP
jgi:two-component system LytT family response regulator